MVYQVHTGCPGRCVARPDPGGQLNKRGPGYHNLTTHLPSLPYVPVMMADSTHIYADSEYGHPTAVETATPMFETDMYASAQDGEAEEAPPPRPPRPSQPKAAAAASHREVVYGDM